MLSVAPLRLIGQVSYGLYVWHRFVFETIRLHQPEWPAALQITIGLAVTVGMTTLSWKVIELPLMSGRRLRPSPIADRAVTTPMVIAD